MKNALPSKKQQALLEFIDGFIREHNYAPSYREVMRALDYKSVSTVASHIEGLIARGWLAKRDNSARSVEVVYGQGQSTPEKSPAPSLPAAKERLSETELLRRLGDAREKVEIGAHYTHYKGGVYEVVDVAIQTGDDQPCVIYRAQYGEGLLFVRPLAEWLERVDGDGAPIGRFTKS